MKYKGYWLILIMLLISLNFSYALTDTWSCNANAGKSLTGNLGYTGYSSNIRSVTNNYTYSISSTFNSTFIPLSYDFDENGLTDYVGVSGNNIRIYSDDGLIRIQFNFTSIIRAMPQLIDTDNDGINEIIILTNSSLESWVYNTTNMIYSKKWNITTPYVLDYFTCVPDLFPAYCVGFKSANDSSFAFNISNRSVVEKTHVLSKNASTVTMPNGVNSITIDGAVSGVYIPFCMNTIAKCDLLKYDGTSWGASTSPALAITATSMSHINAYIAKLGTNYVLFASFAYTQTNFLNEIYAYDLFGTKLWEDSQSTLSGFNVSNWMVGDYDLRGSSLGYNDACYVSGRSGAAMRFLCLDRYWQTILNATLPGATSVNVTTGFVMADFDPSKIVMGFANSEGVYFVNVTNTSAMYQNFTSGKSGNYPAILSEGVFHPEVSGHLNEVLFSANSLAFSFVPIYTVTSTCGDGICNPGETIYTCPADCSVGNATNCTVDAQCPSPYNKCTCGYCVSGFSGIACTDDSQCPFNATLCLQTQCLGNGLGYCVSGVFGGTVGNNNNAPVPVGTLIDNTIKSLFMGSSILRFLVGLVLLLVCTFEFNTQFNPGFKSQAAFIVIFSVFLVLFTFLNLINKWVIFAIIIIAVSMGIIFFIMRFKPQPG